MSNDTKDKLIKTAHDLIFSSSYASVSVAEICKKAGVNKGSFYHFFESKDVLAIAAIEHQYQLNKVIFDEVFSDSNSAMEQLDGIIKIFYEMQEADYKKYGMVCGCPFVNLGSEMINQKDCFNKSIVAVFDKYLQYVELLVQKFVDEGFINKNTDVKILAKTIHVYMLGLKFVAKVENNPIILKENLKDVLLKILNIKN
jgi:TetR/AcrR family transcriptional regulator, transcriptional repressor for nem operon